MGALFGDALHPSQQQQQSLIKFDNGPRAPACVVAYNHHDHDHHEESLPPPLHGEVEWRQQQTGSGMVKVQLLFGAGERPLFVGGIGMSVSELFRKGQQQQHGGCGGLIEVPFHQRYVKGFFPVDDVTASTAASRRCFITLSVTVVTR